MTATGSPAGAHSLLWSSCRARPRTCRRSYAPATARVCRSSPAAPAQGSRAARYPSRTVSSISLARMTRILEIDLAGQRVVVEPGVANLDVTQAVEAEGFFYAPDPSSQQVCTIGGNVAENSGGAHCLKHGFTVNHVTGLSVVLPDGELVELGGKSLRVARARPARRVRRLGRHARHRDAHHAAHRPGAGDGDHAARRLPRPPTRPERPCRDRRRRHPARPRSR